MKPWDRGMLLSVEPNVETFFTSCFSTSFHKSRCTGSFFPLNLLERDVVTGTGHLAYSWPWHPCMPMHYDQIGWQENQICFQSQHLYFLQLFYLATVNIKRNNNYWKIHCIKMSLMDNYWMLISSFYLSHYGTSLEKTLIITVKVNYENYYWDINRQN